MPASRLDAVYRSLLLTKFFTKGWGKPENLRRIFEFRKIVANREACYNLIPTNYPVTITKDEEWSDCHILEGSFQSPFDQNLPGLMPEETRTAYFQVVLPRKWESQRVKPICLHLAGTGDHFYWRRRNLIARPLLKEAGIGAILLENPFYGLRKPKDQIRSSLHNVSDIFVMGGCLIMESIVLLNWCEQQGFGPLGLTGLSMGGHMASLAATNWPKPIPLVPCLSWSTASPVFTEGVMSASINWHLLESQYFADEVYQNDLAKMVKVVTQDDAFLAGQHFAKHYPESMNRMNKLKKESIDSDRVVTADSKSEQKMSGDKLSRGAHSLTDVQNNKNRVCALPVTKHPLLSDSKWREREALQFMRGVMDECTHLKNFEVPVDTELIISVCARDDAYVPREGCMGLEQIWPGAEIRFIDAGHVSAYLLHQKLFRSTIVEAFTRYMKKYPVNNS
ncbi:protein ABHD18 isoform X3 [Neodiprion pinetum]|uniref:protein ABHD18 isoform X3 n=1 Tax=Neodiprion fabricii TaxID=2872261 RepID=UPI001ED8DFC4|nr:protein ABHD18 isoform X3 [Neodiprion fabricii]XP_046488054.1 protein ABHD18 isoform X3 [Neodiprion pinetum]XP_046625487.1 protein ABHD18 isoform X3 [Neodiprion virginianus]